MSQSPTDPQNDNLSLQSYRQGWQALNRLLHENKSFSGRETNNAFLNCGKNTPFADVSSTIGWDFADDARAIGLIDYDHDGDLDLFVTNRTAPRVRLLQNNLRSESNFLSLHLTGSAKTTPRDAIGARAEVHLKEQLVRWHGRRRQNPSRNSTLIETPHPIPEKSSAARIIPPVGHTFPNIPTANGEPLSISETTLIALWSRTCPHCQQELQSWATKATQFKTSNIKLALLCTDQEHNDQANAYLKSINSSFSTRMAGPEAVELLDALHASIIDLWIPIPVPTSFLVSKEGQLLAIYRGNASIEQIINDTKFATGTPLERRSAGTPFAGRWTSKPAPSSPQRTAQQLLQRAQPSLAINYLRSALTKPFFQGEKFTQSDNLLLLGQILGQQGRPTEAIPELEAARELLPKDIRILRLLATAHAETGKFSKSFAILNEAISYHPQNLDIYDDAIDIARRANDPIRLLNYQKKTADNNPENPNLRYRLTLSQLEEGQPLDAIANCKTILRTSPKFLEAANLLSRILSTHPKKKVRSPQESLALASRLCLISKNRNANHLLSLAYAQANLRKFDEATKKLKLLTNLAPPGSKFTKEVEAALVKTKASQPIRNILWK
ncbi:redoxin domain-containing protein [Akkermansiaceae bacterium]|nr:redoxin domain-containing protein [Akkermansiaceae bacterium]